MESEEVERKMLLERLMKESQQTSKVLRLAEMKLEPLDPGDHVDGMDFIVKVQRRGHCLVDGLLQDPN